MTRRASAGTRKPSLATAAQAGAPLKDLRVLPLSVGAICEV